MELIGRDDELERIRNRVAGAGPSLILLSGPRRSGKTSLLRAAVERDEALWYRASPLPDPDHRALLARRLEAFFREHGDSRGRGRTQTGEVESDAPWPDLFQHLAEHFYFTHSPTVVVLDDWHRLVEAHSRITRHLTEFWLEVRRRGIPLHLVLSAVPGSGLSSFRDPEDPLSGWVDEDIRLGPLPYRDVTTLLRGSARDRDRLAVYGTFGGWPDVVQAFEPGRSLASNILGAVLRPDAPLLDWGTDRLLRGLQAPGRYASILRALAEGARSWGQIREGVPGFGSSGQMAPYIQRLEQMGLVEASRSLDASANSRRRRYRIVDPFTAFWFRFVLPNRTELDLGHSEGVWSDRIRPCLDHHLSLVFGRTCRQWLERYADEVLPARAREVGGLWGHDYDLEVAGTLADGAVFYGRALWGVERPDEEIVDEIDRQVDRTRYGFGREERYRFVFTDRTPQDSLLRRAGREDQVRVFDPGTLVEG